MVNFCKPSQAIPPTLPILPSVSSQTTIPVGLGFPLDDNPILMSKQRVVPCKEVPTLNLEPGELVGVSVLDFIGVPYNHRQRRHLHAASVP